MRYTIKDVLARPSRLMDWWVELPWRRRPLRKLKALLFYPGRGWLRWGFDTYEIEEPVPGYYGRGPSFSYDCAPPLRRAVIRLGGWIASIDLGVEYLKDPNWPEWYLP